MRKNKRDYKIIYKEIEIRILISSYGQSREPLKIVQILGVSFKQQVNDIAEYFPSNNDKFRVCRKIWETVSSIVEQSD